MIAWWTGRGYLAMLTIIGVYGGFGAVVTLAFGESVFDTQPWLWSVAALLAASVTWYVGSRINGRPWRLPKYTTFRQRLIYDAPNRFMSLPVETWALPMLVLAVFLLGRGTMGRGG
jgi:hypothetical protein